VEVVLADESVHLIPYRYTSLNQRSPVVHFGNRFGENPFIGKASMVGDK